MEFSGKLSFNIFSFFQKMRVEDKQEMEKWMDDKLVLFKKEWNEEKLSFLRMNELVIINLQVSVEKFRCFNEEYNRLLEKYDKLKEMQKEMCE